MWASLPKWHPGEIALDIWEASGSGRSGKDESGLNDCVNLLRAKIAGDLADG